MNRYKTIIKYLKSLPNELTIKEKFDLVIKKFHKDFAGTKHKHNIFGIQIVKEKAIQLTYFNLETRDRAEYVHYEK